MVKLFEEIWGKQFIDELNSIDFQSQLKNELINRGLVTNKTFTEKELQFGTPEELILTELYKELQNKKRNKESKCEECSKGRLIPQSGGGVHCDRCNYWFCY